MPRVNNRVILMIVILENDRDVIRDNGGTFIAVITVRRVIDGDDEPEVSTVATSYVVRRNARVLSPRR